MYADDSTKGATGDTVSEVKDKLSNDMTNVEKGVH